jgi:hypothetical protein
LGQKSNDSSAIPLCAKHHRTGDDSYHRLGPRKFSERHNLDIPSIMRKFNTKPTIRIESGRFIAHFEGHDYILGNTAIGISDAVRKAVQLCRGVRPSWDVAS